MATFKSMAEVFAAYDSAKEASDIVEISEALSDAPIGEKVKASVPRPGGKTASASAVVTGENWQKFRDGSLGEICTLASATGKNSVKKSIEMSDGRKISATIPESPVTATMTNGKILGVPSQQLPPELKPLLQERIQFTQAAQEAAEKLAQEAKAAGMAPAGKAKK